MKKRTILFILIAFVITGIGLFFYLQKDRGKKKNDWLTEHPQLKDIEILVTATGTVNAVQTVQVGTQVSGVISKLFVDYNDVVHKGQKIAELDMANLSAALKEAKANQDKARTQLMQMENEFKREDFLWQKNVISRSDYDVAISNYKTAKTILTAANAEVAKALTNLQYATIRTPINGVIVSRNVEIGQTVAASFATPTLFIIANDLKKMQLQANVDEADIGQVKIGQNAFFRVDAYPDLTFQGIVQQIRLQPNTISNVVNYTVIIDAPNPDLKLLPGMNADISIVVNRSRQAFSIPVAALKFKPSFTSSKDSIAASRLWQQEKGVDKAMVFVFHSGHLQPVVVKTGLSDGVYTEIIQPTIKFNDSLIVGIRSKQSLPNTKGLFQPPRSSSNSSMRNMR